MSRARIFDFRPEQLANLTSIVWLYRGQPERFLELVPPAPARQRVAAEASIARCKGLGADARAGVPRCGGGAGRCGTGAGRAGRALDVFDRRGGLRRAGRGTGRAGHRRDADAPPCTRPVPTGAPCRISRDLLKAVDHLYKLAGHVLDALGGEGKTRDLNRQRKSADEARRAAVEALKPVRQFHRQALWLQERFPDAQLRDVPGLVKLVSRAEIAANDWSLTPGRYVGVAPEEVDEDYDFEAALRDIHVELKGLNEEAVELAARIARNSRILGLEVGIDDDWGVRRPDQRRGIQ